MTNEIASASKGTNGGAFRDDQGVRIIPGTWWCAKSTSKQFVESSYYLAEKVEYADGAPHSVHLTEPPGLVEEDRLGKNWTSHWKLLVPDLLAAFRPAIEAEALASRDRELADLQGRIARIHTDTASAQADLALIASGSTGAPALLSPPDAGPTEVSEARREMVTSAAGAMAARAERIREVSDRISKSVGAITSANARASLYYAERAKAALASITPALQVAERLREHVDTMGLYVGTGVEATLLVDGASAPASEKLTLLQRRLYMDEELLIHLESGGADFEDVDELGKAFESDPAFLERVFGAPRAVVAMAPRRENKQYLEPENNDFAANYRAVLKNIENRKTFLLVRDGGRIWIVDLPEHLQDLPRLFPTPDDLEAPYKIRDWFSVEPKGSRIGPDSLEYAQATEQFRRLALQYDRVLLLLWGLHDRLGLFGPFADGGGYAGFGDPSLQQERFRLVFDDQMLLGENRPSYSTWMAERNRALRSGSRVAVRWHTAMTSDSAPFAVERRRLKDYDYRDRFRYLPEVGHAVTVVRREGDDFVIDCPVVRETYRQGGEIRTVLNAKVNLSKAPNSRGAFSFLVLDDVDPDDVDHYLSARSEREHYLGYVAVLVAARDAVRKDVEAEAPARAELLAAAVSGGLEAPAKGWIPAIRESIRDWRALNRGAALPVPGDAAWPKAREALLGKMWIAAGRGNDEAVAEAAQTLCADRGLLPLRLSRDGRNRLVLYASRAEVELAPLVEVVGSWPFVERLVLAPDAKGALNVHRQREVLAVPAEMAAERVIRSWSRLPDAEPVNGIRDAVAMRGLVDALRVGCATRSILSRGMPSKGVALDIVERATVLSRDRSHGSVERIMLCQLVGTLVTRESRYEEKSRLGLSAFGYAEDAWNWAARLGDPEIRAAVLRAVSRRYRNPEAMLEAVPAAGSKPVRSYFTWTVTPEHVADFLSADGIAFLPDGGYAMAPWSPEGQADKTALDVVNPLIEGKSGSRGANAVHRWTASEAVRLLESIP